ncbi:MAG: tRNA pseudouridine(55) synthase TruB [Candidatus Saccharibacteria bacterium]|nr:tRNA pseudouridine(55) synthase TruB [Candidatus Saccharibacteria bacterium]
MFDGLLLIDKEKGWTSHDVVAKIRGALRHELKARSQSTDNAQQTTPAKRRVKVGHTGTLDPAATGLLVLVVGSYCKRAQEFSKLDKTYEVTMKLGYTSTTGDSEGVISKKQNVKSKKPTEQDLRRVCADFMGEIKQTPPAYSAVKVNGQRAYALARAGKEVNLEPRKVTIYQLSITNYAYPEVRFTCRVSSGTYIRSLVEDIGEKHGTGAYMTDLRRLRVGSFDLKDAYTVDQLQNKPIREILKATV